MRSERESEAEHGQETTQSGGERQQRREPTQSRGRDKTQSRDEAEQRRENPAEFREMNVEMRETELAGEARFFIERAAARVRLVIITTRTKLKRGAHLAPLTPLSGAAHARSCIRRAGEQRRLRGALHAHMNSPRNRGATFK